jgi:hypothetical protein
MPTTLTCVRCGSPFPYSGRGAPAQRCGPCGAIHKREQAALRQAKWKANPENREKAIAYQREWHQSRKDDPEFRRLRREAHVRYKYGIDQAEVERLIESQGGRCAICGGERNGPGKRLHIDHCHDTGKVRGMLCAKCNTAVGLLDNDPARAEQLARYLRT